jgi:hypothetical protein
MSQRLLAALAVRLGFLFVAIGLPGLVFTILKRLIGRARPLVEGAADPFIYRPLSWTVQYASFPSGHATDAFAIATAIGVLWPWTRWFMWSYAVAIAASRVVVTAHFPSDVIAGGVVGVVGALLVREWFAARGLAKKHRLSLELHRRETDRSGDIGQNMSEASAGGVPAVSIVVPVRNEAANIAPLVAEIAAALGNGPSFEIIYVNDGSADGTESELALLMAKRSWLRQVKHRSSCGQSAAVCTGVLHARAPLIVTLDGDGQNDPAFIPALLAALAAGAPQVGLVAGQRVARKATGFKRWQSRVANGVRAAVLRDGTRDTGCGLKAFRRDLFLRLPYFDGLHRFLPALVRREGYDIGYVEVIDRPRRAGISNYGMWDRLWVGILDLFGVWWLMRRRRNVPHVSEVNRNAD